MLEGFLKASKRTFKALWRPSKGLLKIQRTAFNGFYLFQGQPAAEEIIQHFMNGGNAAELKKDFVRGNRPDYVSPLDDLAFDIYQVSSFLADDVPEESIAIPVSKAFAAWIAI